MRSFIPLITQPLLPQMTGRFEVLIAKARLRNVDWIIGDRYSECPYITALLSFDPSEAQRRTTRVLANSYIAASCEFSMPSADPEFGAALAKVFDAHEASRLFIAIALPDYSPAIALQLNECLAAVRASRHHLFVDAVGIATNPDEWAHCIGLTGVVAAGPNRRVNDALHVFKMFAADMAPTTLRCYDMEDVFNELWPGMGATPARVIEAVWLPEDERVVFTTKADHDFVAECQSLVYFWYCRHDTKLLVARSLHAQVKKLAPKVRDLLPMEVLDLTVDPDMSTELATFVMLCR